MYLNQYNVKHVASWNFRRPSKARQNAVLGACLLIQFVSVGLGFGLSVMYVEVIKYFDCPRSQAALIQSLYLGITVGGGIIWRWPMTKFGLGPCIIAGSVLTFAGLVASAFAVNAPTIIICTGLIGGVGMSPCYLGAFITVGWIFHEDPGGPLIALTVGSSVGQFVIPYMFELLIAEFLWNGTFLIVAAITLNLVLCGGVIHLSRGYFQTGTGNDGSSKETQRECDPVLLKDPVLIMILFCSLLLAVTGNSEGYFIVDIMVIRGFERETGALFTSIVGIGNFCGRVVGILLRTFCRVPTIYHWIYVPLVMAAGHILVTYVSDYWGLLVVILIYGLAFGITVAQTPAIVFETSGRERYPQAIALLSLMYGIGNFAGGFTGGLIKDETGSYDVLFELATGCSVFVSMATILMLCILRWTGSKRFSTNKRSGDIERTPLVADDKETSYITYQSNSTHSFRSNAG